MEQVFADLVIILPLLEGPEADAVFRQQVRLIESTQNQITGLPTNLPSEPLIGTGLRAADNALEDMFAQQFPDQTEPDQAVRARWATSWTHWTPPTTPPTARSSPTPCT